MHVHTKLVAYQKLCVHDTLEIRGGERQLKTHAGHATRRFTRVISDAPSKTITLQRLYSYVHRLLLGRWVIV